MCLSYQKSLATPGKTTSSQKLGLFSYWFQSSSNGISTKIRSQQIDSAESDSGMAEILETPLPRFCSSPLDRLLLLLHGLRHQVVDQRRPRRGQCLPRHGSGMRRFHFRHFYLPPRAKIGENYGVFWEPCSTGESYYLKNETIFTVTIVNWSAL